MSTVLQTPRPGNLPCESCNCVDSLMRTGVPLAQIEDWLDSQDGDAPDETGRSESADCLGAALRDVSTQPIA